ncbi:hypothetical protein GALMADRAFT_247309 [Galerina marginata CBS 339.88]|uniref:G protein-coupled receptor n=1 Tax=Galerina marginata (strain CBS 339.88) TaxID=685588 RepID=A0A067TAS7_GALM3|nr:hypothetical protein GALMADRAFT_247309 [Galerina marginata CBS 339.88]
MSSDAVTLYYDSRTYSRLFMVGVALSAVAYGAVVALFLSCIRSILTGTDRLSRKKKATLAAYTTTMSMLSTLALIQVIASSVFEVPVLPQPFFISFPSQSSSWILPLAIWGADGFKMWRCGTLYRPYVSRAPLLLLVALLVSLGLISLISGILLLASPFIPQRAALSFTATPVFMLSLSAISNLILSIFITVPILVHQKNMRAALGRSYGRLYTNIVIMCTESCALVVVPMVVYIILYSTKSSGSLIPLLLLPHLSVISPLLIVSYVVQGTDVSAVDLTSIVQRGIGSVAGDIHFSSASQLSLTSFTQISTQHG